MNLKQFLGGIKATIILFFIWVFIYYLAQFLGWFIGYFGEIVTFGVWLIMVGFFIGYIYYDEETYEKWKKRREL